MKSAFMIILAVFLGWPSQSARAGNLLTHSGWTVTSGSVVIGGTFATFNNDIYGGGGTLAQSFATTPGTNYIVQFIAALTGSNEYLYGEVYSGTNASSPSPYLNSWETYSTQWVTQDYAFTANSGTTTISFNGYGAYLDLAKTSVTAGSFTQPGTYTGSVTKTTAVLGISASHTETVTAQITASGGIYAIAEPSTSIFEGGFASDSTIVNNNSNFNNSNVMTTGPATLNGSRLTFSISLGNYAGSEGYPPVTETDAFSLTFQ